MVTQARSKFADRWDMPDGGLRVVDDSIDLDLGTPKAVSNILIEYQRGEIQATPTVNSCPAK